MIPHVLLEISWRRKGFRAKCTGVWLDFLMSHLVIVEVGGGREPFATGLTLVRLLSCVNPPVSVETGAGGAALSHRGNTAQAGPVLIDICVLDIEVINTVIISNLFRNTN